MISRREFFTRVSTGLVGAAVVTRVPLQWLPTPVQKCAALEYMRLHVNTRLRDDSIWNRENPLYPKRDTAGIIVGPWLYTQIEDEMVALARRDHRLVWAAPNLPVLSIMFKGLPVIATHDPQLPDPRTVIFLTSDQWARHRAWMTRKL